MKKSESPKFIQVAPNEVKIEYKGNKFCLIEKAIGVYGAGKVIKLYKLDEFEKKLIKEIGWTRSDGHSSKGMSDSVIPVLTNMEDCKKAAIKYIDLIS
jgi:hypothetical protein